MSSCKIQKFYVKYSISYLMFLFFLALFAASDVTATFNNVTGQGDDLDEACKNSGIESDAVTILRVTGGVLSSSSGTWPITKIFTSLEYFEVEGNASFENNILPDNSFNGSETLKTITIANLREINSESLSNLQNLQSFVAPGIEIVHDRAFQNLKSLETFYADSVKELGKEAFAGSGILRFWNSALQRIGDAAFENCVNLSEFHLQTENVSFGTGIFKGCSSLASVHC